MKWPRVVIFLNILVTKCWTMTRSELEEFSDFIHKTSQLDLNLKSELFVVYVCVWEFKNELIILIFVVKSRTNKKRQHVLESRV